MFFVWREAGNAFAIDLKAWHRIRNAFDGIWNQGQNLLAQIQKRRLIWLWRILQKVIDVGQMLLPNSKNRARDG